MSISTLSHRLVFPKVNTLPLDLEDQMESAFKLGRMRGEELSKLSFRAIEANSRKLPDELRTKVQNYACNRAIAAAYYHGVSSKLLATKMSALSRQEGKKLAARAQRLILQLILSVDELLLDRLQEPVLPDWSAVFTGAMSVARAAVACQKAGFEVRYPRPVVDVLHFVDLFCTVNPQLHLAIQVKTGRASRASLITENSRREVKNFYCGVTPLARRAQRRGSRIVPVWAVCAKQQSGLDCAELQADLKDICSALLT